MNRKRITARTLQVWCISRRRCTLCTLSLLAGLVGMYVLENSIANPAGVWHDSDVYVNRRERLVRECSGNIARYRNKTDVVNRLIIDPRNKLIYCPVYKVASTFWKSVFQISSGMKDAENPFFVKGAHDNSLPVLDSFPLDRRHWLLKNYTKFVFVRDPYSRLVSCYIDKFFTINPKYWQVGRVIIRQHRLKPSSLSLRCGHDVTFPEFIKHVISTLAKNSNVDEHWRPIYQSCGPCLINYDIVGKMETIYQDLDYMLHKYLSVPENITFGDAESESETTRLKLNTRRIFSGYYRAKNGCMSLPGILERLLRKEKIRGIIDTSVRLPSKFSSNDLSREAVENFLISVYNANKYNARRKLSRKEALIEAFNTVPLEDMVKLQKLYKPDFDLFGYNPQPEELYRHSSRTQKSQKLYFS